MKRLGLRGSFWPTMTQDALLRITLGPPAAAAAIWRELQPIDIEALDAGSFSILPLLYERLSETMPAESRIPLLLGTYRSTWFRNQLVLERLCALLAAFREREVEPLVFGGAAILLSSYPRLGSRPLPQLEVAVDPDLAQTAAAVAESGGWQLAGRDGVHRWFFDDDGRTLVLHEGMPPLVAGSLGRAAAFADLRARARHQPVLAESMLVLQPTDELIFICGLGARAAVPPTIQWLVDAARMLAAPDRPHPDDLVARARKYSLVEPVRDTVTYLAQLAEVTGLEGYVAAFAREPIRRRDDFAYRVGGASVGALGGLSLLLASGLRATSDQPIGLAMAWLPHHLQEVWGTQSMRQTFATALRKLLRMPRRQWARVRTLGHPVPAATPGRNRSASS